MKNDDLCPECRGINYKKCAECRGTGKSGNYFLKKRIQEAEASPDGDTDANKKKETDPP